ncbi:MAG TPA: hypothetical protein VFQ91_00350 [Bryobacteraceae bacterium]|nr:hypothetical protein [Bryobacteraceae bacterium]
MWSYKLFRIGALISTLTGIAHLLGFLAGKNAEPVNGIEIQLRELLTSYKTNMAGTMRTTGDILDGLHLTYAVFMLTLAALGFVLPVQRKAAIVFAASFAVMVGISLCYWFAIPTVLLSAACACYAGSAYLNVKK